MTDAEVAYLLELERDNEILRATLAEAEKDTRRLDWLAASAVERTEPLPIECWYLEGVYSAAVIWSAEYNFPTAQLALRAALDAAMALRAALDATMAPVPEASND
jgi:hypothetical protein